jgi:tRNA(Ile)-lysidine synthase
MASSRKLPSAEPLAAALRGKRRGKRVAVALSGGMDSVVLLHLLKDHADLRAVHVHHGLSPNADAWAAFCRKLCRQWRIPLKVARVQVRKSGKGLEAAAREARYRAFAAMDADVIALAHHLDDQAETVLINLLRGSGLRGASGMRALARFEEKVIARPLLDIPRQAIEEYARRHRLQWVEDESNADEALTRNFVRRRLGPQIETRFPRWKSALARAARLFAAKERRAQQLLRSYLESQGLKAPSEAKLAEMLKQLTSEGAHTKLEHDGRTLRVYRGRVMADSPPPGGFAAIEWKGERRLKIPALGGELRFKPGAGIAMDRVKAGGFEVRLRAGGERLQLDPRRPRRTLKNLFQEAGVPPWARSRMPLLFRGADLVWAPGLGVDVRYRGAGLVPEWRAL